MSRNTFLLSCVTAIIAAASCVSSDDFDTNSKIHPFANFIKRPMFYPIPGLIPRCTPPRVTQNCLCGEVSCGASTPNCVLGPTGTGLQCTDLDPCTRTSPMTCTCGGMLSPGATAPYCNPRTMMWIPDLMDPTGNCFNGKSMDCLCGDGFICVEPTPFCHANVAPSLPVCIATPVPCTTPTQPNCGCGFPAVICQPPQVCETLDACV